MQYPLLDRGLKRRFTDPYRCRFFLFCKITALFLLSGCKSDADSALTWQDIQRDLQTKLIMAKNGDTIRLEEGYFLFSKGLMLEGKSDITIMGAGSDRTTLSFKDQREGAEGLKIANCRNIQLLDFTIEDAKGDNLKITETDGLRISGVLSRWTGKPKKENGAYAFYPVLCKHVLIEDCTARGASDAGIYVGQSEHVIIRNCTAMENVAGIESENSSYVDIYNNLCQHNTGGILVFDLPGLTRYGNQIRVFDNKILSNNYTNFAPKGNIVGMVPAGTGIMVLSTRDVEIFSNEIAHNRTTGTAIISYELVLAMSKGTSEDESDMSTAHHNNNYKLDSLYNPYPSGIFIHSNTYSNKHRIPTLSGDFGKLLLFKFFWRTPDILFDGFIEPAKNIQDVLCIQQESVRFANIDAPADLAQISKDKSRHDCKFEALPTVEFTFPVPDSGSGFDPEN